MTDDVLDDPWTSMLFGPKEISGQFELKAKRTRSSPISDGQLQQRLEDARLILRINGMLNETESDRIKDRLERRWRELGGTSRPKESGSGARED